MTVLRQSTAAVLEFLDLIEMLADPPTESIMAHLEHYMSKLNGERPDVSDAGRTAGARGRRIMHR